MFDSIRIYKKVGPLDTKKFHRLALKRKYKRKGESKERDLYIFNRKGFTIKYFADSTTMVISGRLVNWGETRTRIGLGDGLVKGQTKEVIIFKSKVRSNYEMNTGLPYDKDGKAIDLPLYKEWEELWEHYETLEMIIEQINEKISNIFKINIDISKFKVSRFEAAFNIETPYVAEYIELFNRHFSYTNPKSYKNHVLEKELDPKGSYYIKTNADYINNEKKDYAVNFYNKYDQLINMNQEMRARKGPLVKKYGKVAVMRNLGQYGISQADIDSAKGILRLEVQAYSRLLKEISIERKVERTLIGLIDVDLSRYIIVKIYTRFLGDENLDFYSQSRAKSIISEMDLPRQSKQALLDYCLGVSRGQKYTEKTTTKHNNTLAAAGIFPFFISNKLGIPFLESPIKILDRDILEYKQRNKENDRRYKELLHTTHQNIDYEADSVSHLFGDFDPGKYGEFDENSRRAELIRQHGSNYKDYEDMGYYESLGYLSEDEEDPS